MSCLRLASLLLALLPLAELAARAQTVAPPATEIGLDQHLDEQVPLHLEFRDEAGAPVTLERYFHDRPVVLALVYYECPMLCTLVLNGLTRALNTLSFTAGREFQVVVVSIDPRDTPARARDKHRQYVSAYGRAGAESGWHFLTGAEPAIAKLAASVGFRYRYDASSGQFAHASGIMVLTPQGRLSRYFYGVEYDARDLRLGLVEASRGKIGSIVEQVLLLCFHYDPTTGKYGLAIMTAVRTGGILTLVLIAAFVVKMMRKDRHPSHA